MNAVTETSNRVPFFSAIVPAVVGFVGVLTVVAAQLVLQYGGATALGSWPVPNPFLGQTYINLILLLTVGMVVTTGSWLMLWQAARQQVWRPRAFATIAGLWAIPCLVSPPLFSVDVYGYMGYGFAIDHGLDPYMFTSADVGDKELVSAIAPVWRDQPMGYGPLFGRIASWLTVPGHHTLSLILFRLAAVLVIVTTIAVAATLAKDARVVVAGLALNPIILFHGIGGMHLDIFVTLLIVTAAAAEVANRPWLSVLAAVAAIEIKSTAGIALASIMLIHLAAVSNWVTRIRIFARDLALIIGGLFVGGLLLPNGWGWIHVVMEFKDAGETVKVPYVAWTRVVGTPIGPAIWFLIAVGVLVTINVFRLQNAARQDRIGLSMIVGVAVAPVLHVWYLLTGIALLADARSRSARYVFVAATAGGVFMSLYGLRELAESVPGQVMFATMVVIGSLWLFFFTRHRSRQILKV